LRSELATEKAFANFEILAMSLTTANGDRDLLRLFVWRVGESIPSTETVGLGGVDNCVFGGETGASSVE